MIFIHVPDAAEWSPEELALSLGGERTPFGEIVLRKENERLIVELYHDLMTEYEKDALDLLHSLVKNPVSYTVIWRDERLLEQFLNAIPRNLSVVIDDDYGNFVLLEPNTQIINFMENRRKQSEEKYEGAIKKIRKQIDDMKK
jgi:hypothetical protein